MALTRAQLLAGNESQGIVLPGQVQAVSQGPGVFIDTNGQISVDAATTTGLVKLNNGDAYNSYVWPNAQGTAGQVLKAFDSNGNITWGTVQGGPVVTVSLAEPLPADVGELWYDGTTGYLKIFQNLVSPNGWTNVAQAGLPVDPDNTTASPDFVSGNGTIALPYVCSASTTTPGTSLFIVNTVTVSGLAPFQYVPIVDQNAAANGGRFHFTNYYANAGGFLTFQTVFVDLPASSSGITYTAAIRIGYSSAYIRATVNVVNPLVLVSPGTISGNPFVGDTLTYTPGFATGGVGSISYSWQWKDSTGNTLATDTLDYEITSAEIGKSIFIELVASDSAAPPNVVTGNTLSTAIITRTGINGWTPVPANGLNTIPGGISGGYNGPGTTVTVSGCLESSVAGGPFTDLPKPIASGQTLAVRWSASASCGGAPTGTPISGSVSDGIGQNNYSITVNRLPAAFSFNPVTNATPLSTQVSNGVSITGIDAPAYVTLGAGSTATIVQGSTNGGSTWFSIPASGTTFSVTNNSVLLVRLTTDSAFSSVNTAIINVGDGDNVQSTTSTFSVTNADSLPIPTTSWDPNPLDGMTTIPGGVSGPYTGPGTSITATGCIEASVNGGGYGPGPFSIAANQVLAIRWKNDPGCGGSPTGTNLLGSVTDGIGINAYSISVDRTPLPFTFAPVNLAPLNSTQESNTIAVSGINTTAYVTYGTASTGTNIQGSRDGGSSWFTIPASGLSFPISMSDSLKVRLTTDNVVNSVNTAIINIGDGDNVQETSSTFEVTNTSLSNFPNFSTTPVSGPNASPDFTALAGPALYGTAVGNPWNDGFVSLRSTGSLQFKVGAGSWGQSPANVINGDIVYLRWDPAAIAAATDNSTLSGTLTNLVYRNSYSISVTKTPGPFAFANVASGAVVGGERTSDIISISDINCPAEITVTAPGSNALAGVQVSVNGAPFQTVPPFGSPGITLNPSKNDGVTLSQIQIRGTTGTTVSQTYTTTINIGNGSDVTSSTWSVTNSSSAPSIVTPTIQSPSSGSTVSIVGGVNVSATGYVAQNGAGSTQTSSTWEAYEAISGPPSVTPVASATPASPTSWDVVPSLQRNPNIVYSNGVYLAGNGASNYNSGFVKSTNGSTFTVLATPSTPPFGWFKAANGRFFVYSGGVLYRATAPDVDNWTIITNPSWLTGGAQPFNIVYGNGVLVLVGTGRQVSVSNDDGLSWQDSTETFPLAPVGVNTDFYGPNGVAFSNGYFVVAMSRSYNFGTQSKGVWRSTDGLAWELASSTNIDFAGTNYGFLTVGKEGQFILTPAPKNGGASVYTGTQVATSVNGFNWVLKGAFLRPGPIMLLNDSYITYRVEDSLQRVSGLVYYTSNDLDTWTTRNVQWCPNSNGTTPGNINMVVAGDYAYGGNNDSPRQTTISIAPAGGTSLAVTGAQTAGMQAGDTVVGSPSGATGTIVSVSNTAIVVAPQSATWANGDTVTDTSRVITPGAPTTNPPDPLQYTAVTGSPFSGVAPPLTAFTLPEAALATGKTYYVRTQYSTANPVPATSSFSPWSSFST